MGKLPIPKGLTPDFAAGFSQSESALGDVISYLKLWLETLTKLKNF